MLKIIWKIPLKKSDPDPLFFYGDPHQNETDPKRCILTRFNKIVQFRLVNVIGGLFLKLRVF